jgi:hypothetical protein
VTGSIAEVAGELRAGLARVIGSLGGVSDAAARRSRLAEAVGTPELTPEALLLRLAATGSDRAGELWPPLIGVLCAAARQVRPPWTFAVLGVVLVDGERVDVLSPVLPAEIGVDLRFGPVRLTDGIRAQSISVVLTIPVDASTASLRFAVRGLGVALPDDDLLRLLVPGGLVFGCDLGAGIDSGGARFDGGGRSSVVLPVQAAPSGVRAPALHLAARGDALRFVASFGGSLFGVAEATIESVGVEVVLGPGGLATTFVAPTGAGLRLALGPVKGAGYLENRDGRYGGRLALSLGVLDVNAFGILRAQPMSLLVVLGVEFTPPIELGLAFTLNAVGGILGVNYAIDRAGLAAAVQAGHLDDVLFPADPAASAPRILATLESVFRVRAGSAVVGPMFRLAWGRPISYLTADLGLVLELPSAVIGLVGRLRVTLPAAQAPIIDLRAALAGVVDAANGLVEITADLAGSRLLSAPIEGGLVLRVKSGPDAVFILSAGGFHPRFTVPPGLPVPRRLSIAIADSPLLRITFTGYFAVTPGTVQAGAALTASIGTRDLGVSGRLGFDAMVVWEPSFGLVLDLNGSFELHAAGASLCSVDLRVRVEGPTPCWHIAGRASVSLFFIEVTFPFDEHWGCTGQVSAPPPPDVARRLEQAVADPRGWEPLLPPEAGALVTLKAGVDGHRLLHPLGRLRFSQRVVPLGVAITRFGPGRLPVARAFELAVAFGTGAGTAVVVTEQFARADFFDLTEAQKLTEPAFEPLPSGAELSPPAAGGSAPRRRVEVRYETKWIGTPGARPRPGKPWLMTGDALAAALGHGAVARSAVHADRVRYLAATAAPRALKDRAYVVVRLATLHEEATVPRRATLTEARAALAALAGRDLLQVVPAHEVRS